MTPTIPGQENVTHIPSAIERELAGRMGGGVVDTKEVNEQVKQQRQQQLVRLMEMGFPPQPSWFALKHSGWQLGSAITALTNGDYGMANLTKGAPPE